MADVTPTVIPGRAGAAIQKAGLPDLLTDRLMVMFAFIDGDAPDESQDVIDP